CARQCFCAQVCYGDWTRAMETDAGNGRYALRRAGKRGAWWWFAAPCGAPSLKSLARALLFIVLFFSAGSLRAQDPTPSPEPGSTQAPAEVATPAPPPAPVSFEISGVVRAGKTPLPGVTVTASNSLTGKKFFVATSATGTYTFTGLPRGRY